MSQALIEVVILPSDPAVEIEPAITAARRLGRTFLILRPGDSATAQRAEKAGATLATSNQPSSDAAAWAIANLPLTSPWTLILNANERPTPGLIQAIHHTINTADARAIYNLTLQPVFLGRAIRHGGVFAPSAPRLIRRDRCQCDRRNGHAAIVCPGPPGHLADRLLTIPAPNAEQFLRLLVQHADAKAHQSRIGSEPVEPDSTKIAVDVRTPLFRPRSRRARSRLILLQMLARFCDHYLLRSGFRDGRAGWHLAMLMASGQYMTGVLIREKNRLRPAPYPAPAIPDRITEPPA